MTATSLTLESLIIANICERRLLRDNHHARTSEPELFTEDLPQIAREAGA